MTAARLKSMVAGFTVAILATGIWLAPALVVYLEMNGQADFWYRNYKYQKDQYVYYFDGANERGLLDICPDNTGGVSVRFKEDCR